MIIIFQIGTEILNVKIDDERRLSFFSRFTNNQYVDFDKLVQSSGQDSAIAAMTKRIVSCRHCLPENKDVELYILDEFKRTPGMQGLRHIKTEF